MTKQNEENLPITEELDFAYLLEMMPALHSVQQFTWLPELFSIIGHERLLKLCKYAGGETIRIPTLDELSDSIEALQWYYDINIKKEKQVEEIPLKILPTYKKVVDVYNAQNYQETDRKSEE